MLYAGFPTWRAVAARLDLLRSTGPRHAWRRLRQDRVLRPLAQSRREQIARELWADAAGELGATVTELEPGRFEIRRGRAVTIVAGQSPPLNSPAAMTLAADKPAVYGLLADAGLPTPDHLVFASHDLRPAKSFLVRGPVPCVVKPARGRGGDGVTGEVRSVGDLRRAVLSASRFGSRLLVERQVPGEILRLLVLDGQVLDVLRRNRPAIRGDGRSTVEQLIFAENDRRIRAEGSPGLKPFVVDLDCALSLRQSGVPLRSVPPAGSVLPIKTVTNYNNPEDNESLRTPISPELTAEVVTAVEVLGLRLAGVDVVTSTPAAALSDSGGAIIDVNEAPALHHHAYVADAGEVTRVAVPILHALLDRENHDR
jgi:D-alanine-D-alanine ligase-like ATP-grasp enzyme